MKKTAALLLSLPLLFSLAGCRGNTAASEDTPEASPIVETTEEVSETLEETPTPEMTEEPDPTPVISPPPTPEHPDSPFDLTLLPEYNTLHIDPDEKPSVFFETNADMDGDGVTGHFTVWWMHMDEDIVMNPHYSLGLMRAVLQEGGKTYYYEARLEETYEWWPMDFSNHYNFVTDLNKDGLQEIVSRLSFYKSGEGRPSPVYWFRLADGVLTLELVPAYELYLEAGADPIMDSPAPYILRVTSTDTGLTKSFDLQKELPAGQRRAHFFNDRGVLQEGNINEPRTFWWTFEEFEPGVFGFCKINDYEYYSESEGTVAISVIDRYITDGTELELYDQDIVFCPRVSYED